MAHHDPRIVFAERASAILYHLVMSISATRGVYLVPTNVCPVVVLALIVARRPFEFIDIDPVSLCMSHALVHERLLSKALPRVAGIVFVRTYGFLFDATSEFRAWKSVEPELLLIDDRCLSHPVVDREDLDWQRADAVLFSTGYAKAVDIGFGGFAYLQPWVFLHWHHRPFSLEHEQSVIALYKAHIQRQTPLYKAAEVAAPPLYLQELLWLDTSEPTLSWPAYRKRVVKARALAEEHTANIIQIYRRDIPQTVQLPSSFHSWRFQIRVPHRKSLLEKIFAAGFFATNHYFPAATLFGAHLCPVATALSADIVNLFHDFRVSLADAEKIGKIVRAHLVSEEVS